MTAASCALDVEGSLDDSSDGGGGSGGQVECWVGQKICNGKCYGLDDPEAGCASSACDPCIVPGAQATCEGNVCAVESCLPGYEDCDKNQFVPGCEVNIANDPKQCGACGGEDCTLKGPTWICKDFVCQITDCVPPTTGDCNNDKTDGCEIDLLTDLNNCGFCGNVCNAANADNACTNGQCTFACQPGFADCNGQPLDGCEINLNNDKGNCSGCGVVCNDPVNGNAFCNNGGCDFQCTPPYSKCPGINVCLDLSSDVNNCGSCGNKCVNSGGGQAFCSNGSCTISCTPPLVNCSGTCVDTATNKSNCGSCGNSCPIPAGGSSSCVGSTCQKACPSGQTVCGSGAGTCFNLQTSNSNCGTCGNACTNERICVTGNCQCPSGAPKACPTSCEPECCGNGDCAGITNAVCKGDGTCGCPASLPFECGGACRACCQSSQCSGGKECSGGVCQCPGTTKDCGTSCAQECCNTADCTNAGKVNSTCVGGVCGCAGSYSYDCLASHSKCCGTGSTNCGGGCL